MEIFLENDVDHCWLSTAHQQDLRINELQ